MLRIYRAPDGTTWRYEEGTQPAGFELVRQSPAPKRRAATPDKARTAQNKAKGAE